MEAYFHLIASIRRLSSEQLDNLKEIDKLFNDLKDLSKTVSSKVNVYPNRIRIIFIFLVMK